MKAVLYIGDFKAPHSTENYVTYGLQQNGVTVYKLSIEHIQNSRSVLGAALEYQVDFVLFSKGRFPGCDEAIQLLRENKIKTFGWIFDLFFGLPAIFGVRVLNAPSFKADTCFVTDGGHENEWRSAGVRTHVLRQGIHEPEAHYGTATVPHPEIVFIGTHTYDGRIELLNFLHRTYGNNFRHYGIGGNVREVRGERLNDVVASAKIVVGDSVPSPHYWSNRIYEIMGRGGFLMHPRVAGLESEYTDGIHYVGYDYGAHKGVKEMIDFYLTHDKERERIRAAGHLLTREHYTYTKRCATLLEYARANG